MPVVVVFIYTDDVTALIQNGRKDRMTCIVCVCVCVCMCVCVCFVLYKDTCLHMPIAMQIDVELCMCVTCTSMSTRRVQPDSLLTTTRLFFFAKRMEKGLGIRLREEKCDEGGKGRRM